jgi:hypothetical protein
MGKDYASPCKSTDRHNILVLKPTYISYNCKYLFCILNQTGYNDANNNRNNWKAGL